MKNVNNEVVEFYKKLGYTLIEIKSSVFREEESTLVFQTDNKNHTVDGSTILYDHAIAIHHQLQKAHQDWLQEEIVKLENEKVSVRDCERCNNCETATSTCERIIWGNTINEVLQTIIDRYHEELDQLTRDDWNEDMERSHTLAELDQDKGNVSQSDLYGHSTTANATGVNNCTGAELDQDKK